MNKLTIFTGTLSHGGSERVISILTEAFIEKYDSVEIILFYDLPIWYKINEKVKIINISDKINGKKNILSKALWLRKYIKSDKPDVFISFLAPFNIFSNIVLAGIKIPKIVAERNDPRHIPQNKYLRGIRNFIYNFTNKIIVQTQNNKIYFNESIQDKISIIHNPVSIGEYSGKALITKKKRKIVTVGRLIKQKNQKMLIEAFKRILVSYEDYQLIIYGEGEMRGELNQLIKLYNLENNIKLVGAKENILEHLLDAELFVLTSDFEGMPNALIEAMCLGLPCISTKVSGAVDLIESGVNGILIDKNDVSALEKSIRELLDNKELAYNLGKNATFIESKLSIDNISEQWINEINKCICENYSR